VVGNGVALPTCNTALAKMVAPSAMNRPRARRSRGGLLGLVVRMLGDASVHVHLPDGEVYDLDEANVVPAREAASRHVPV
jgi:hypothetical protein